MKKNKNKMNEQQLTAFKNPCLLAEETINTLFGKIKKNGLSVIVTVNRGYE